MRREVVLSVIGLGVIGISAAAKGLEHISGDESLCPCVREKAAKAAPILKIATFCAGCAAVLAAVVGLVIEAVDSVRYRRLWKAADDNSVYGGDDDFDPWDDDDEAADGTEGDVEIGPDGMIFGGDKTEPKDE